MPRRPQPSLESLAANLRRVRERLGLTQDEMAERVGFEPRRYQRIERGKLDLRLSTFVRLCDAVGESPNTLLRSAKLPAAQAGRPRKHPSR